MKTEKGFNVIREGAKHSDHKPPATQCLPTTSPLNLFFLSLPIAMLLWLPLAVLLQIDALLAFMNWASILSSTALLATIVGVFTAILSLIGWAVGVVAGKFFGCRRDTVAWNIALLPPAVFSLVQFAYEMRHWLEIASAGRIAISSHVRLLVLLVILVPLAYAIWRVGFGSIAKRILSITFELRWTGVAALVVATAVVLAKPPILRWPGGENFLPTEKTASVHGKRSPDIILITMDALAAQDAGPCADASLMPNLRRLAEHSTCFLNYYASSNFTTPTSVTIETGALPWTHWATQIGSGVVNPLVAATLGSSLRSAGYDTVMVSANENASPLHHGTFASYSDVEVMPSNSVRSNVYEWLLVFPNASLTSFFNSLLGFLGTVDIYASGQRNPFDAGRVYSRGLELLAEQPADRPIFLWLHTLAPHAPYLPPAETRYKLLPAGKLDEWGQFMPENSEYRADAQTLVDLHRKRYDECVMGADVDLGRFLSALVKAGRFDRSVIIVSADHGDSFEKGYLGHAGSLLHNALIHIPLVVKLAGQQTEINVSVATSEADIAPTISEISGARVPKFSEGRSLMPALLGSGLGQEPVYSMSLERQSRFRPLQNGKFAVIIGRYKLLYDLASKRSVLFDLEADPEENRDVASEHRVVVNRLLSGLLTQLEGAEFRRMRDVL